MSAHDYSADPLESLRRAEDSAPPPGAQERVLALLSASSFGASLAGGALCSPPAGFTAGALRQLAQRFAAWSLLPLAAGVIIGASGQALLSTKRAQQASPPAATVALLASALPPQPRAESASSSVSVAPVAASNSAATSLAKVPTGDVLSQERAVLDRARQKLAVGEPEHALQFLEQHARRYPNGKLTEEREAMLINVLVSIGRAEQAKAHGAAFSKRFPSSLMLSSVKAALADHSPD